MKLSNQTLSKLIKGAYQFKTQDGYLTFRRFDEAQLEYLKFRDFFEVRSRSSASVTAEFMTDANEISFDFKVFDLCSCDTVDVYVNNFAVGRKYVKDIGNKGKLSFALPEGKKRVTLYFPTDAGFGVKNFKIEGSWRRINKKAPKVLWIGDSITQGYGSLITGITYVNVANRILGYDILNQGIGGYYYDAGVLTPMEGYYPDKIILAMGTNQYLSADKEEKIVGFFEKFRKVYPTVPTLVITPLWRGDAPSRLSELVATADIIKREAMRSENVTVVDGFDLLPHLPEYYMPDLLHPNPLGMQIMGETVAEIAKKIL
ncbi:MAG: SGNH/GDSL hydrolase family protein [Clostridia bacterium]|nr:SGNH/GDSL hydrolase family protein [Clostridia bacterium]